MLTASQLSLRPPCPSKATCLMLSLSRDLLPRWPACAGGAAHRLLGQKHMCRFSGCDTLMTGAKARTRQPPLRTVPEGVAHRQLAGALVWLPTRLPGMSHQIKNHAWTKLLNRKLACAKSSRCVEDGLPATYACSQPRARSPTHTILLPAAHRCGLQMQLLSVTTGSAGPACSGC